MSKQWEFAVDKHSPTETWKRRGKAEWPNGVRLTLTRYRAWSVVRELLAQLERLNDDELLDVYLPGELTEADDE